MAETGWPLDKVARYADPPLRERAYIVELAQRAYVRGTTGSTVLFDLVADTVHGATWDAYRAENGRWHVTASNDRQRATWIYDPAGRSVHPVDNGATKILGAETVVTAAESAPEPEPTAPEEIERPRLVSVPADIPAAVTPPAEPTQKQGKKNRRGRARVPSWDEILFGATRPED